MGPGLAARLSRVLVGWHRRRWRGRYGEEMLDVLDQHQASTRTVASLGASAVSAHLDPAYRTDRLSLARLPARLAGRQHRPASRIDPVHQPAHRARDSTNYSRVAFEANLPRIETNTCNRSTGAGCTLIPTTDKGAPAAFYPFFSAFQNGVPGVPGGGRCMGGFGNSLPGATTDFGRNAQYGSLLSSTYLVFGGHGATTHLINNFRQILPNPCTAGGRPG